MAGVGDFCNSIGVPPWNWIAVRINIGLPKKGINAIDQEIADGMLHVFSFFMNLVPSHLKGLHQELLNQPMATNDPEGKRPASFRESHPFIRRMSRETSGIEGFEHACDRPRRDAQRGRQLAGTDRLICLGCRNLIDRFDVIFDGETRHSSVFPAGGVGP